MCMTGRFYQLSLIEKPNREVLYQIDRIGFLPGMALLMGAPFEVADPAQQGGLMLRKIRFPCGARNPHVMHKIQQGIFGALGEASERVRRVSDSKEPQGQVILCEGAPGPVKCLLPLRHGSAGFPLVEKGPAPLDQLAVTSGASTRTDRTGRFHFEARRERSFQILPSQGSFYRFQICIADETRRYQGWYERTVGSTGEKVVLDCNVRRPLPAYHETSSGKVMGICRADSRRE